MTEKKRLHDVYLGLGTNFGNKVENMRHVLAYIEKRIGKIITTSPFYVTNPMGFKSDNQFLNAACHVQSKLSPLQILKASQSIERDMGRTSKSDNGQYADRIIDIDILLYDDLIIKKTKLTIPHPRMQERDFVMLPLTKIARDVVHPVLMREMREILKDLKIN